MCWLKVVLPIAMVLGSASSLYSGQIACQFSRSGDSGLYLWLLQSDLPVYAVFIDTDDAVHLKNYSTPKNWALSASWEKVSLYQQFDIPAPTKGRWLYYYAISPDNAIGPGETFFSLATSIDFSPGPLKGFVVYQDGSIVAQQIMGPSQTVSEPGGLFIASVAIVFAYLIFFRRKSLSR